jgi:hypothetical protein
LLRKRLKARASSMTDARTMPQLPGRGHLPARPILNDFLRSIASSTLSYIVVLQSGSVRHKYEPDHDRSITIIRSYSEHPVKSFR